MNHLRVATFLLVLAACVLQPGAARGHALNSASLILDEVAEGTFRVRWESTSAALEHGLGTPVVFPTHCRLTGPLLYCGAKGLVGPIEFPWLAGGQTQVLVTVDWRNGERLLRVVTGDDPRLVVYGIPASAGLRYLGPLAFDYTRLGIEHILTGYDHLLFVLGLALLLRWGKRLLAAITAFTVAHSLTLAAAVLGLVHLAAPPVEALIALSIVLVCGECLRPEASFVRRAPWAVTFAFGLLHGLGFASSLLAIGLPESHVPAALLFFNCGVELGQLGVLAVAACLGLAVRRLGLGGTRAKSALVYAMGSVAAWWTVARMVVALAG